MGRTDYYRDPDAPRANSVVPSVVAVVRNAAGELLLIHPSMRLRIAHGLSGERTEPYLG